MSYMDVCNNSLGVIQTRSFSRHIFRFLSACSTF